MTTLLQIPGECESERIVKIGQYLTKLCVDYVGLLFWPTLYNLAWKRENLLSPLTTLSSKLKMLKLYADSIFQGAVFAAYIRAELQS